MAAVDLPIYCTEWNSSPSSRDYAHDYLQETGYIAWTAINTLGKLDALSYWTFTDIFKEEGPEPEAFHGGFGLITIDSIPKPSFNAMRMVSLLGGEIIARESDAILTKRKDGSLAIMAVNWPEEVEGAPGMSSYPDYRPAEKEEVAGEEKMPSLKIKSVGKIGFSP